MVEKPGPLLCPRRPSVVTFSPPALIDSQVNAAYSFASARSTILQLRACAAHPLPKDQILFFSNVFSFLPLQSGLCRRKRCLPGYYVADSTLESPGHLSGLPGSIFHFEEPSSQSFPLFKQLCWKSRPGYPLRMAAGGPFEFRSISKASIKITTTQVSSGHRPTPK
jgi:hypothetical protein